MLKIIPARSASETTPSISSIASSNFLKRFNTRRKALNLSQVDLARLVNVSVNTIQSYEQGKLPRGQHFIDVAKALQCSVNWLVGMNEQGECRPIDDGDVKGPAYSYAYGNSTAVLENSSSLFRPLWLEERQGLANADFQARLGLPRRWLTCLAAAPENVRLMKISGEAMAPTLNNGNLALIDLGNRDIRQACLYCLKTGGHYFINRLEVRPGNQLRLINDNYRLFPPFEMPVDQVEIVGRIIWASKML